ncbi:MAG: ParB/RepB/Spo0J family partition protein [Eubacteriales bacterium]
MKAAKNSGLGRGLEALFNDVQINIVGKERVEENIGNSIIFININDIAPNPNQPRKDFKEEKIEELADSIKEHGIIQPIMVRKAANGYEIVAGERRWRAARKAQLKDIPCIVKELDEHENMIVAIIENMQREDLNPLEEAKAFQQLGETFKLTQEEISKSVSRSRPYITNALRLLKLPEEIQQLIVDGSITSGHARAIAGMKNKERQIAIARNIVEKGLSVRQVEEMAKRLEDPKEKDRQKQKNAQKVKTSKEIKIIEEEMIKKYGTKVKIVSGKKRGRIEIEYYSKDELERLIDLILS